MPRTGNLWLAAWARSGSTLLRSVLWHCFDLKSASRYAEYSTLLNRPGTANLVGAALVDELWDRQRLWPMKIHEHPIDDGPAIYVIRDGREACTSYLYMLRKISGSGVTMEQVIRGECLFGSWSANVRAWHPRPDTLFLRYEDLKDDLHACLISLAGFLGLEPVTTGMPEFEQFQQQNPKYFRAGRDDTWRDTMTQEDLSLFMDLHGEVLSQHYETEQLCNTDRPTSRSSVLT